MVEAVCIASGPSLTESDVQLVKTWREASEDRFVIVANTTFRIAPWADAMYAMDDKFWEVYGDEINRTFPGKRYCQFGKTAKGIAERVEARRGFMPHGNSGAACIAYCASLRMSKIVMLGYDASKRDGKTHWHGDHPRPLGNCGSILRWPRQFANVRAYYRDANIINASRKTALTMFPRATLEQALGIAE